MAAQRKKKIVGTASDVENASLKSIEDTKWYHPRERMKKGAEYRVAALYGAKYKPSKPRDRSKANAITTKMWDLDADFWLTAAIGEDAAKSQKALNKTRVEDVGRLRSFVPQKAIISRDGTKLLESVVKGKGLSEEQVGRLNKTIVFEQPGANKYAALARRKHFIIGQPIIMHGSKSEYSPSEFKHILSHEMGHVAHGDIGRHGFPRTKFGGITTDYDDRIWISPTLRHESRAHGFSKKVGMYNPALAAGALSTYKNSARMNSSDPENIVGLITNPTNVVMAVPSYAAAGMDYVQKKGHFGVTANNPSTRVKKSWKERRKRYGPSGESRV